MATPDDAPPDPAETVGAKLGNELKADVYAYCGGIDHDGFEQLVEAVKARGGARSKNVCLFLTTNGGNPDVAYSMSRLLKHFYRGGLFTLVIWRECKSAGTLIAISAGELAMTDLAELGPLDTQVQKQDELFEMSSSLTSLQAFKSLREYVWHDFNDMFMKTRVWGGGSISTKMAAGLASQIVIGLYTPIYAQIDPARVAEHARAMTIGQKYGTRLGAYTNLRPGGLDRLISGYPTHSFVIDSEEAKEIFMRVRECSSTEAELLTALEEWTDEQLAQAGPAAVRFLGGVRQDVAQDSTKATETNGDEKQVTLHPTPPPGVPAGERSRPGKVDQEGSGTNPAAVPGGPPALVRN